MGTRSFFHRVDATLRIITIKKSITNRRAIVSNNGSIRTIRSNRGNIRECISARRVISTLDRRLRRAENKRALVTIGRTALGIANIRIIGRLWNAFRNRFRTSSICATLGTDTKFHTRTRNATNTTSTIPARLNTLRR